MRWGGIFDIDSKRVEVEEEELRTHVPDFWEHQKEAQAQMKKVKELHQWIDGYDEIDKAVGELSLAWDFLKDFKDIIKGLAIVQIFTLHQ